MFIKTVSAPRKNSKPVRYVQIVESRRPPDGGPPRHKILLNLGREDEIDQTRVAALIELLGRFSDEPPSPGAAPVDGLELGGSRDLGVPFVIEGLWKEYKLGEFLRAQLRSRKIAFSAERAIFAMIAHRAHEPTSKLQDFHWLHDEGFLPSDQDLELQHFYRALDFLEENHEALEQALFDQRRDLFNRDTKLVFFDTTTISFEVEDDPEEPQIGGLRQYGRPKDGRTSHRVILAGMAVDPLGLPLLSQVFPGNTMDAQTIKPVLKRLKALGVDKTTFVMDRGGVSEENLEAIRSQGLHYIVGLRLRRARELHAVIDADKSPYETVADGNGLLVRAIKHEGRRLVICYSPASAERDLRLRGRAVERLNERLEAMRKMKKPAKAEAAILSHGMFARWVVRDAAGNLVLSREAVAAEARCDGTFVLETNNDKLTASEVALGYKSLLLVESAWRALKHSLDIAPVFHRKDERLKAHVTLCMIAYLLERTAELRTERSFDEVRRLLRPLRAQEIRRGGESLWQPTKLSPAMADVFKKLQMAPPEKVLHSGPLPRRDEATPV